jgi:RHS repeat-associated protein
MTVRREKLEGIAYVYTQTWTIDNRLASVIKSDLTGTILATTTIAYDGDGVRVKKADPSGTTYYLGTVEVLITGTTQVTTSYYAFGGAMVAMRTAETATLTYLHGDHLGSVSLTTDASGNVVSQQRYKPYGDVRWSGGAGLPTDFTFTSQRAGPPGYVGSLTDFVARYYSPALGRFVSADTIVPGAGNPASFNRYAYVLNSPLKYTDPTGHDVDCERGDGACRRQVWAEALNVTVSGVNVAIGMWQFREKVQHYGEWDIKRTMLATLRSKVTVICGAGKCRGVDYSTAGNILYGFVGTHIGLDSGTLYRGGGHAETTDESHSNQPRTWHDNPLFGIPTHGYFNEQWASTYYDDPTDHEAIRLGIDLYATFGADMTYEEYIGFLTEHMDDYGLDFKPLPDPMYGGQIDGN